MWAKCNPHLAVGVHFRGVDIVGDAVGVDHRRPLSPLVQALHLHIAAHIHDLATALNMRLIADHDPQLTPWRLIVQAYVVQHHVGGLVDLFDPLGGDLDGG